MIPLRGAPEENSSSGAGDTCMRGILRFGQNDRWQASGGDIKPYTPVGAQALFPLRIQISLLRKPAQTH